MDKILQALREIFDEHFNTMLIFVLILFFATLTLHMIHHASDATALQWVEGITGQFVSALLTLLVAKRTVGGNDNSVRGSGNTAGSSGSQDSTNSGADKK